MAGQGQEEEEVTKKGKEGNRCAREESDSWDEKGRVAEGRGGRKGGEEGLES